MEIRKKYIRRLLIINGSILAITAIYSLLFLLIFKPLGVSMCFIKEALHIYCPGCGGTRALILLLSFRPIESFLIYPPLIIGVVILFELDLRMLLCAVRKNEKHMQNYSYRRFYILALAIILNFFIKNLFLYAFNIDLIGDILR